MGFPVLLKATSGELGAAGGVVILAVTLTRDGGSQLYTIDANGGEPRRLMQSSGIDTEPVFSGDGRSIFFVSDRGGAPQIYRVPAAGGGAERVTFTGSYNISPALSPDV